MAKLIINNLNELLATEYPPQEWIVSKLVPKSGLVVLSAQPSSYKTWIMQDIALTVAKGEKLFYTFDTEQSGVLIIDEESGCQQLQARFKYLGATSDLPVYYTSRTGRLIDEKYVEDIIETCEEKNIRLVMVDSLVRIHNAKENDSGEMSRVLNNFKRVADKGITCMILHHHRKSGNYGSSLGEAMRGSGDILASVDIHISLDRKGKTVKISQSKNRYCEEIEPIIVTVESDAVSTRFRYSGIDKSKEDRDAELKSLVHEYIAENEGKNKSELTRELKEQDERFTGTKTRKFIDELIKSGEVKTKLGDKNSTMLFIANNQKGENNGKSI